MLTFGVEIECTVPTLARAGLRGKIEATGLTCVDTGRYHSGLQRTAWKLEADGSLRADPGFVPLEIVSPPLEVGRGFEAVEKVCGVLAEVGAQANRSCGLHVHIGIANVAIGAVRKLAELYAKHEPLIDQLIPPSRRGNSNLYCRSVTRADLSRIARANTVRDIATALNGGKRQSKLNLSSYWRYSTVEFRHHSGTIDASKITKWITFCASMVQTAIREADTPVGGGNAAPLTSDVSAPYAVNRYWRRGRARQIIFNMLSRPEGATAEEVRVVLGIEQRPYLQGHLRRAGVPTDPVSRRGGAPVFRISMSGTATVTSEAAPVPAPLTLAELYDKLSLSDEDKEFWKERTQILGGLRRNSRSVA